MHASSFIAILAATAATASPLMARSSAPSFAPAPSAAPSVPSWDSAPAGTSAPQTPPPATGVLGNPNATPNPVPPKGIVAELLTQDTTVSRFKQIKEEIDAGQLSLVFDHNPAANPNATVGEGGQVDLANRANFPILTGLGIASAAIFYQPCGLNTPHIHPRSPEYFTVATKSRLSTGFVLENNLTEEFKANLTIWQATVFPQGAIHWQQNEECEPAVAIGGFNNEDPGASSLVPNLLRFTDPDVVDAALGFPEEVHAGNFAQYEKALPVSLAKGVKECLVRCGIPH